MRREDTSARIPKRSSLLAANSACPTSSQIGAVLKLRIKLYDTLKTGRNLNVDIMSQRELTLVDLVWIFSALIFLALMCFCMVLLARGANQLATTQAQAIPASTPAAASLRPLSESNREAHPQSVTAITPQESQNIGFVSTPAQASSEVPNRPTKWTQSPSPSFAVSIEKRENERFLPLNSRHLRGEKTVGGVWDNLPTFRRVLA